MEGVEDIPGTALHEGIQWEWESFPEYLDALARRASAMDVGHAGAARRGAGLRDGRARRATTSPPPRTTSSRWRRSCGTGHRGRRAGLQHQSRTMAHRAIDRRARARHLRRRRTSSSASVACSADSWAAAIFEVAGAGAAGEDVAPRPGKELDWMRRLSARDRPARDLRHAPGRCRPDLWRELLDLSADAGHEGRRPGVPAGGGRPFGMLVGHQTEASIPSAACRARRAGELPPRGARRAPARSRGARAHPGRGRRERSFGMLLDQEAG